MGVQSFTREQWSGFGGFLSQISPERKLDSPEFKLSLEKYLSLLLEKNEHLNLTAIRSWEEAVWKHLADSLALLHWENLGSVLDWGTGGGLPGIPLLLARRSLGDPAPVRFVDSVGKKIVAVQFFLDELGFAGQDLAFIGRGEQLLHKLQIDSVVMRAVAPPEKAVAWMGKGPKRWIIFCGPKNREVWLAAQPLLAKKRLKLEKEFAFELPQSLGSRYLLQFCAK